MTKIRIKEHDEKAKSADVKGFIKKHPHHKRVKPTRRYGVKHAGVRGHLRRVNA